MRRRANVSSASRWRGAGSSPFGCESPIKAVRPAGLVFSILIQIIIRRIEAAAANHFSSGHRLWAFGLLVWIFLPLLFLLPVRMVNVRRSNRKMDAYFQRHAFRLHPIPPGEQAEGFVFTSFDAGNKVVHVRLMGHGQDVQCIFTVPIPGLNADYLRHDFEDRYRPQELVECDIPCLRHQLAQRRGPRRTLAELREGDPVNLVVVGDFATVLSAFGARWDETETITLATCWKTLLHS